MNKRHLLGIRGETLACNYLRRHGFQILHNNYRYKRTEIDLICRKDNWLVFVEVKTRTGILFGYPEECLTEAQAERITEAAGEYIRTISWTGLTRFDIVAIIWQGNSYRISHFEDAFY